MEQRDEKMMVSTNALNAMNRNFKKQLEKRTAAPPVAAEKAGQYIAAVTTAPAAIEDLQIGFCAAWKKYYPVVVQLLGWASWFIPGPAVNVIKSLLATVNSVIIPTLCAPPPQA